MNKSLFSFAILLLLFVTSLDAQSNALNFYTYTNNSVRIIDNTFNYNIDPLKNINLSINGFSSMESRLSFNQNTKLANLNLYIGHQLGILKQSILSGYDFHYDKSDVEESLGAYRSKTGYLGYELGLNPLDSLSISLAMKSFFKRELDRYVVLDQLISDGLSLAANARYAIDLGYGNLGLSSDLERKELDWEYYTNLRLNAYLYQAFPSAELSSLFNLNNRQDKLYDLVANDVSGLASYYLETDTQRREYLMWDTRLSFFPYEQLEMNISENYMQRMTKLKNQVTRNNSDFQNQVILQLDGRISEHLILSGVASHSYAIKDFSFTNSTRHTDQRALSTFMNWQYAQGDSILFGASIDLQRTSYPDDDHRLDNDLRNIGMRAGWKHYYKDRIRLAAKLLWSHKDDVYIDSLLSANNNQVNSLSFLPEIGLLLGDRLLIKQNYQIRVDYTDYLYDTPELVNGLYRQFSAKYNFIFDSFPYIARSQDIRWLELPYRQSRGMAFLLDASFAYERSEYGYDNGAYYIINSLTRRYIASLTLRHDINDFYYLVQPKYSWGTWKEYSLLAVLAYKFNNQSSFELTINPTGEWLDELDWKLSLNLSTQF